MGLILKNVFNKKRKIKMEFCQNNLDLFLENETIPLFTAFFSENNVSLKEYNCLSECELCKTKPYAKVNGEIVLAEDYYALLSKLDKLE